jgi:hypothetical protein
MTAMMTRMIGRDHGGHALDARVELLVVAHGALFHRPPSWPVCSPTAIMSASSRGKLPAFAQDVESGAPSETWPVTLASRPG